MGLILLQNSKGGLSGAAGGGEFYRSKRGAEKIVFMLTIAVTVIFFITSIINLVIR
jgi:protein translocase SecG subunit